MPESWLICQNPGRYAKRQKLICQKTFLINKYRKENNVPRNFFFPSERFDELYKTFYKGDDDEGDDDEGDDDGGRNPLEVSALSIIRSKEMMSGGLSGVALRHRAHACLFSCVEQTSLARLLYYNKDALHGCKGRSKMGVGNEICGKIEKHI